MALCETYTPSAHCNLYPSNLPCSKYLNATTPTYVQGKYLGEQTEYAQEYNKALQEIITDFYLVLPNPICREYLRMLLCHRIYPQCMPQNTTTGIVLDKKQKICQRACNHLQSDLCYGLNNNFKNIIMTFMSINFRLNAKLEIRNEVEDFLNTLCFQDENAKVGDDNDEEENCFFMEGNRNKASESCDGHGYNYKGTLDTTEYNNTCNMWTSVCLKHSYINFTSISSADRNYCRNPGGYRERPWCYVKNSTTEWEYCQLPKCPAINGNYTEWSSWSMCDASCNAQGFEFRQRNCSNPIPRFGGRNCSSIGEYIDKRSCSVTCSTDDAGVSNVYIGVICAALILILLAGMGSVRMYLRKKNTLPPNDEKLLDSGGILEILAYREEDEVDDVFEAAYMSLKQFQECSFISSENDHDDHAVKICVNCIEKWMYSLLEEHSKEENKIYVKKLMKKLKVKYHGESDKTGIGDTVAEDQHYDVITTTGKVIDCSSYCFFEHDVKEWLKDQIDASYDHLSKNHEDEQLIFLRDGLYFNYLPIYHKLRNGDAPVTSRQL